MQSGYVFAWLVKKGIPSMRKIEGNFYDMDVPARMRFPARTISNCEVFLAQTREYDGFDMGAAGGSETNNG